MKGCFPIMLLSSVLLGTPTAFADTAATGKYTTRENLTAAFTASIAAVSKTGWTLRSSDAVAGKVQAVRVFNSNEFSALILEITQQPDHVLIEVSFTYYSGFIGCCKPFDYAKKYGKQLKSLLPDLTVEVIKDTTPRRVAPTYANAPKADQTRDEALSPDVEPVLTNEEVVKLAAVDLGDEIVIAKIKNAHNVKFDVSTAALVALKAAKVSSPVITAMIERAAKVAPTRSATAASAATTPAKTAPQDPCADIELMGLFKEDMRPVSPLIIYLAKIRSAASVTKIVHLEWLDMYGQGTRSTVQVSPGQIATLQLATQEPFQRQPVNLRLAACQ